ncbi:hypothetical protein RDABS01_025347, partial [Bienertia sinuspersici]
MPWSSSSNPEDDNNENAEASSLFSFSKVSLPASPLKPSSGLPSFQLSSSCLDQPSPISKWRRKRERNMLKEDEMFKPSQGPTVGAKLFSVQATDSYFPANIQEHFHHNSLIISFLIHFPHHSEIPLILQLYNFPINSRIETLLPEIVAKEGPNTIVDLKNIKTISFFSNNFSGRFARLLVSIVLNNIRIAYNRFSRVLPQNLYNGFALQELTVNFNKFIGSLPECIRKCTRSNRVWLEGNQFKGNITGIFRVHPHLDFLNLAHNKFFGTFSHLWGDCSNFTQLEVTGYNISRGIPSFLGNLQKLVILKLNSDELGGNISTEIGKLLKLEQLSLSKNHSTGYKRGKPMKWRICIVWLNAIQ